MSDQPDPQAPHPDRSRALFVDDHGPAFLPDWLDPDDPDHAPILSHGLALADQRLHRDPDDDDEYGHDRLARPTEREEGGEGGG